tara:strand:+ start:8319 stop:8522 length:204 start_codon:yes stop_codon:yes gene_type:complete
MIFYRLITPNDFVGEERTEYFATKKQAVDYCIENKYPTNERDIRKCYIKLNKRDLILQFNVCSLNGG